MTALPDAVKFTLIDPAGTDTLPGTVRFELLLESPTAAPPLGAAVSSVTVQVEEPAPDNEAGLHDSEDTWYTVDPGTATVPPLPETVYAAPPTVDPRALATPRDVDAAVDDKVTFNVATIPFAIVLEFIPATMHVNDPVAPTQEMLFPAVVAVAPALAEMDWMSEAVYGIVHCKAAGAPPVEVKDKFSGIVLPGLVDPEDKVNDPVWESKDCPVARTKRNVHAACRANRFVLIWLKPFSP